MSDPDLWAAYKDYANNDNEMNYSILMKLLPEFPSSERRIMDRVLRCAVEPRFVVDVPMLEAHLIDLREEKAQLLVEAGITDAGALRSNAKFEALLRERGVDILYKASITNPDAQIPAFAKTDDFMADLLEHEDPVVQALATARLGQRSTIEETRAERMLSIANLECAGAHMDHLIPVPLKYCGAHTHRLSGDWRINLQNLPAGRGTKKSKLRKSLKAPDGQKVVVADKSQIEARINAWLCGQHDLLALFASGGDPYSVLASSIFGFKVDKNVHKIERFIGKSGELGLGFGCGADKFYNMVVRAARTLGMDVKELLKVWTPQLAQKAVDTYRASHGAIVQAWRQLDVILRTAWMGQSLPVKFGPVAIGHKHGSAYVEGPGGLRMNYANPREMDGELWYDYGKRTHKMYGSKFLENIVQFLARIDTMHDALRISGRGFNFILQSHDELAWIVPDDKVAECQRIALEEMRRSPSWGQGIPLNAECSFGQTYGDAK
jgi:DNA polymerase